MVKQGLIYFLLSILVVLFAGHVHLVIVYIDLVYTYISLQLALLFKDNLLGSHARSIIMLVFLPLIIAGIPALIWRAVKGKTMPYFVEFIWLLWILIAVSKVLIH